MVDNCSFPSSPVRLAALSGVDSLVRTPSPPVQGVVEVLQCSSERLEERADLLDQPHMAAQVSGGLCICPDGFNSLCINQLNNQNYYPHTLNAKK